MKNGANSFVGGVNVPLTAAIFKRHENVALLLAKELGVGHVAMR